MKAANEIPKVPFESQDNWELGVEEIPLQIERYLAYDR